MEQVGLELGRSVASLLEGNQTLTSLSMRSCYMASSEVKGGCYAIFRALRRNYSLTELDLSHCSLMSPELNASIQLLTRNHSLAKVDISHNECIQSDLLADIFAGNEMLTEVAYADPHHTDERKVATRTSVKSNRSITTKSTYQDPDTRTQWRCTRSGHAFSCWTITPSTLPMPHTSLDHTFALGKDTDPAKLSAALITPLIPVIQELVVFNRRVTGLSSEVRTRCFACVCMCACCMFVCIAQSSVWLCGVDSDLTTHCCALGVQVSAAHEARPVARRTHRHSRRGVRPHVAHLAGPLLQLAHRLSRRLLEARPPGGPVRQ